jgi:hypothetical protein
MHSRAEPPGKRLKKQKSPTKERRTISSELAPPGLLIKQDPVPGVPLRSTPG